MKDNLKNVQLWIHQHYDGIKLTLAIITLFMLVIGLYYQNFAIQQQATEVQYTAREAEKAAKSAQETTEALDRFTRGVGDAVTDIKSDNLNQTVILCTIILRSNNVNLTDTDTAEIQRICEQEVQRFLEVRDQSEETDSSTAQPESQQNTNQVTGPSGPQGPQGPSGESPQSEAENNQSFLAPVINPVRDLTCNTLGLLCRNP